MLSPDDEQSGPSNVTYTFQAANAVPEESQRLDMFHQALSKYFGERLSLASLPISSTRSILDIGSGSGAWAVDAAVQFAHAQVFAVDINPPPERTLPTNLVWQQMDVTRPFPFPKESFDIIHARFIMMHIPNGEQVISRVVELLRPGGWILIEEPDDDDMLDGNNPAGPATTTFIQAWLRVLRGRGANPCIGRSIQLILEHTAVFSEMNVRKVRVPYRGDTNDSGRDGLGTAWMRNAIQVARELPCRFHSQGVTKESAEAFLEEIQDSRTNITTVMYFIWARKYGVSLD